MNIEKLNKSTFKKSKVLVVSKMQETAMINLRLNKLKFHKLTDDEIDKIRIDSYLFTF